MAQHNLLIENNPGRAVRTDFNNALESLKSNNSGTIEPPSPRPGQLWLDLSVLPDGLMRQRNQSNTGWINMLGVPEPAVEADILAGTNDSKYVPPAILRERYDAMAPAVLNRVVNPAMQVSQQNGDTAAGTTSYYVADQWMQVFVGSGAVVSMGRNATQTPRGSNRRIRGTVTTAKTGLGSTDYWGLLQPIEGTRINDLGWGAAGAKSIIVRFGFRGPAGTYAISLRNGATNRSYVSPFTVSAAQANTDIEIVKVVPGDVTGTWITDSSGAGIWLGIYFATGGGNQGAEGWQIGNVLGYAGMSNGLASTSNVFDVFDVGLYEDVTGEGTPPRWQLPNWPDVMRDCQRYYQITVTMFSGNVTSGSGYHTSGAPLAVDMRKTLAAGDISSYSSSGSNFPAAVGSIYALPCTSVSANTKTNVIRTYKVASGTGGGYFQDFILCNARMT